MEMNVFRVETLHYFLPEAPCLLLLECPCPLLLLLLLPPPPLCILIYNSHIDLSLWPRCVRPNRSNLRRRFHTNQNAAYIYKRYYLLNDNDKVHPLKASTTKKVPFDNRLGKKVQR